MSKRYKTKRTERFKRRKRQCQHEGCKNEGVQCQLPDYRDGSIQIEFFCGEHAHLNGYCRCCGQFWAGVDAFDFNKSGLCPHCQDEVDEDFYEPEADPDYDFDFVP